MRLSCIGSSEVEEEGVAAGQDGMDGGGLGCEMAEGDRRSKILRSLALNKVKEEKNGRLRSRGRYRPLGCPTPQ